MKSLYIINWSTSSRKMGGYSLVWASSKESAEAKLLKAKPYLEILSVEEAIQ